MRIVCSLGLILLLAALAEAGGRTPRREDVPKYMEMLKSKKAADRALAAEMIGKRGAVNGKDVAGAVDSLKMLVKDDADAPVRAAAALALGSIAPDAKDTVPLLIGALEDKEVAVKVAAIQALGLYGAQAKAAVPQLRELAKEGKDKKKESKDEMRLFQASRTALKQIMGR